MAAVGLEAVQGPERRGPAVGGARTPAGTAPGIAGPSARRGLPSPASVAGRRPHRVGEGPAGWRRSQPDRQAAREQRPQLVLGSAPCRTQRDGPARIAGPRHGDGVPAPGHARLPARLAGGSGQPGRLPAQAQRAGRAEHDRADDPPHAPDPPGAHQHGSTRTRCEKPGITPAVQRDHCLGGPVGAVPAGQHRAGSRLPELPRSGVHRRVMPRRVQAPSRGDLQLPHHADRRDRVQAGERERRPDLELLPWPDTGQDLELARHSGNGVDPGRPCRRCTAQQHRLRMLGAGIGCGALDRQRDLHRPGGQLAAGRGPPGVPARSRPACLRGRRRIPGVGRGCRLPRSAIVPRPTIPPGPPARHGTGPPASTRRTTRPRGPFASQTETGTRYVAPPAGALARTSTSATRASACPVTR